MSTESHSAQGAGASEAVSTKFVCMIAYTNFSYDARVRREAQTLASHGFHVRCLTAKTGAQPARLNLDGVEVRELNILKYRGKSRLAYAASYARFLLATTTECLRLLVKGELDVVHVHNLPDFLVFSALLPRLMGKKVVLDVHDSVPETFATKFSRAPILWKVLCLEERLSALVAHRVICVNGPQRDALVARGIPKSKTFISMNVPDPRIFASAPVLGRVAPEDANFNLVYHGTMSERLGVDLVIRAVARLRDRLPHLRLHLWGGGDDLERFQRLARELKVEDAVLFRPEGFVLDELPRHLRTMQGGVVGNRRSSASDLMLPVKLLEYVSLDIPAIVPRLRAIQQYFSEDMVLYYEPDDVESLAEAVSRLCCQTELRPRLAKQARAFLMEYGWEQSGPELVGMYRELVETAEV